MLRTYIRDRGVFTAAVLTIAVGVTAVVSAFGVVNAALMRQPPFPQADRLAMLYLVRNPRGEPQRQERWSFARFELLKGKQKSFEKVASYSPTSLTISGDGDVELVEGERVSASYFAVLGVGAATGRLFTEAEDDPAAPSPIVLLSHSLWSRRFGADQQVLGRPIRLNGVTLTVVGVLPPGFSGISGRAEVWMPRTLSSQLTYAEYVTTNQNFISAIGRLRSGVELSTALGELSTLGGEINREVPSDPEDPNERVTATAVTLNQARADSRVRSSLLVLLGGVLVLHLLACANATNLLLGRVAARRKEMALRLALGSSSSRLFRHVLGEGTTVALVGGAIGVAAAAVISKLVAPPANVWAPRNFYGSIAPFDSPAFGSAELGFGLALVLLTALAVALPTALGALHVDVVSGLKAGARGVSDGAISMRRLTLRGAIVGVETALAMLLVVAAGLLIDSFQRMRSVDVGVADPSRLLTFWVIPSEARIPPEKAADFVSDLLEAVGRVPGVESATVDGGAPLAGSARTVLYIAGRPLPGPGEAPVVLRHYVGFEHFSTLGIPLMRGRAFGKTDVRDSPRVTIVSAFAAERFWPGEDPIGKRVWFGSGSGFNSPDSSAEIVGVVGDVAYQPLDQPANYASFYTPYTQFTYASRMVFARTSGEPLAVVSGVRRAISLVDPDLAMREAQPLSEVINSSWARNRFDAVLFGGFGLVALLLAASGIFAVLTYAVANRTREFGVRMALGASSGRVMRHVIGEGMVIPVTGLAAGGIAAIGLTRVLQSSLYGVSPQEPRVFIATAALLLAAAATACLVPAWRATRADPMEAMRTD